MIDLNAVERLARGMAEADGYDPDEQVASMAAHEGIGNKLVVRSRYFHPLWKCYHDMAYLAIVATEEKADLP